MTYPSAKTYGKMVVGFSLVELLSWLAYSTPTTERLAFGVVLAAIVWLGWKRPVWLAYVSVAELMVGSKGYLFFLDIGSFTVSLRMALFVVLLLAVIWRNRKTWTTARITVLSPTFLFFVGWLAISIVIGAFRHNSVANIYSDANAFLYLGLLPAWWLVLRQDTKWRTNLLALLLAAATIIGFKSWLMVLLFGQEISNIRQLYTWIRNTGVGEITYINTNLFRVFFQSQIYSLLALCVMLVLYIREHPPKWLYLPMAMSALGVYVSLSRSFWLGLGVAILGMIIWMLKKHQWKSLPRLTIVLPLGVFAWAMLVWALSFPTFSLTNGRANAAVTRLNASGASDAATSRQNQIQPLLQSIGNHPVIGSGFGTTVSYLSTDPRTKGMKTTTAFELGYFDLWLKLGLVGLILYALWVLGIWRKVGATQWGSVFVISGLALVAVHLTSPYLNHPLGLGWFMLTSLYAYDAE